MSLLTIFVLGAAVIVYSLVTHSAVRSHVNVLNTRQPMNVLVGVKGTPLDPGFVGFVAEVKPGSDVLNVVPISGRIPVTVNQVKEPLYQAFSDESPKKAMKLVAQWSGAPIDHYFYLNIDSLDKVLNALYYHSPHWPKQRTPLTMLEILGYPGGRIQPKPELNLMRRIVNRLPLINPIAAASLLSIPNTAQTNLTKYELFLLANYVRGDELRLSSVHRHRTRRGSHG